VPNDDDDDDDDTSSLYKLRVCVHKYTFTYNLTVSLDIKPLFSCSALVKLMTHIKTGQLKREITEFSNIYMTLKSMSE